MKRKQEGILKTFKAVPMFKSLSITQIQRLCQLSQEETFVKGGLLGSPEQMPSWTISIVLSGTVKMKLKEDLKKSHKRVENCYILAAELGPVYGQAMADGNVKLCCIPTAVYEEVLGEAGRRVLAEELSSAKPRRGVALQRQNSIFSTPEKLELPKVKSKKEFELEGAIGVLGDFGYLGNFKDASKGKMECTIKVIAKKMASDAKMDAKLLQV